MEPGGGQWKGRAAGGVASAAHRPYCGIYLALTSLESRVTQVWLLRVFHRFPRSAGTSPPLETRGLHPRRSRAHILSAVPGPHPHPVPLVQTSLQPLLSSSCCQAQLWWLGASAAQSTPNTSTHMPPPCLPTCPSVTMLPTPARPLALCGPACSWFGRVCNNLPPPHPTPPHTASHKHAPATPAVPASRCSGSAAAPAPSPGTPSPRPEPQCPGCGTAGTWREGRRRGCGRMGRGEKVEGCGGGGRGHLGRSRARRYSFGFLPEQVQAWGGMYASQVMCRSCPHPSAWRHTHTHTHMHIAYTHTRTRTRTRTPLGYVHVLPDGCVQQLHGAGGQARQVRVGGGAAGREPGRPGGRGAGGRGCKYGGGGGYIHDCSRSERAARHRGRRRVRHRRAGGEGDWGGCGRAWR